MSREDLLAKLVQGDPVLCKDGAIGKMVVYPTVRSPSQEFGIQIQEVGVRPIRWIPLSELVVGDDGSIRQLSGGACDVRTV